MTRPHVPTPEISVITVAFNAAASLEGCLASVAAQQGVTLEHIVIDGGSSDGSAALLERWSDRLAYWHSRPDDGIADAMNQGIGRSSGNWLLFLHADDELLRPDSLAEVMPELAASSAAIVGFPIRHGQLEAHRLRRPRGDSAWLNLKTGFYHQATFIRRSLFADIGGYDTRFRIAMDYEFFLRAHRRGIPSEVRDHPVPTLMRDDGLSSRLDWPSLRKRLLEERAAHFLLAGSALARLAYRGYWLLYLPYRWLRAR